jgi:hypothetical protein
VNTSWRRRQEASYKMARRMMLRQSRTQNKFKKRVEFEQGVKDALE